MASQEWCTIESDPGLFTELISDFGAKDLQVDEIFDLSQDMPESYGLIFLFKWRQEEDPRQILDPENVPGLFFARQVSFTFCDHRAGIIVHLLCTQHCILTQMYRRLSPMRVLPRQFCPSFSTRMKPSTWALR